MWISLKFKEVRRHFDNIIETNGGPDVTKVSTSPLQTAKGDMLFTLTPGELRLLQNKYLKFKCYEKSHQVIV